MKKFLGIFTMLIVLSVSFLLTACTNDNVKIKEIKTKKIQYETFNNGLISMKIPKGWTVNISQNADFPHFTFMVYDPDNTDYRIFVNLKYEGFLKSQAAKNFFKRFRNPMSKMPVLSELSTEYYFKNSFNDVARLNSNANFAIPIMNNFTVIQNFGKTVYGGDLLRATYTNKSGKIIEGMFTASPKEIGSYYVNENPLDFRSKKIDTYYRNVYNTMFITAPESEFNNWEKILTTCLDSLQFSDNFVRNVQTANDSVMKTVSANSRAYAQISNMVMSSWEKRNKSYDIMSQKRSDATLGYERVYDTEKGEVYKAYNGFSDDYKGKRYLPVSDDMYAKPIVGYIEK